MKRCELTKVELTKDRVDHKPFGTPIYTQLCCSHLHNLINIKLQDEKSFVAIFSPNSFLFFFNLYTFNNSLSPKGNERCNGTMVSDFP